MGALTSKPYAFTARPWELRSVQSRDCFDAMGSSLRLDMRGLELMRILPFIDERVNEEWISDKARFSYDALKRQRLTTPLVRSLQNDSFAKLSWIQFFPLLWSHLYKAEQLNFAVGPFISFETVKSLSDFYKGLNLFPFKNKINFYSAEDPYNTIPTEWYSYFSMNNRFDSIEKTDFIFLVGANPRLEAPILNLRLRRQAVQRQLTVFLLGVSYHNFPVSVNLGRTVQPLVSILQGRHPVSSFLGSADFPAIFFGSSFFRLINKSMSKTIWSLFTRANIRISLEGWGGLHYLPLFISSFATFDLLPISNFEVSKPGLLWSLGDDRVRSVSNRDSVIYQGHHGDRTARQATFLIPSPSPFESNRLDINMTGELLLSRAAMRWISDVRSEADFFYSFTKWSNKLFFHLTSSTNFLNPNKSRFNSNFIVVSSTINYLGNNDTAVELLESFPFRTYEYSFSRLEMGKLYNDNYFLSFNDNYYLTDSITRNSPLMALAFQRFQSTYFTFNK